MAGMLPKSDGPASGSAAIVNTLPAVEDVQEAGTLARELAAAFKGIVEHYRDVWKMSPPEALAKAEEASDGYIASTLKGPADQVSWHGLDHLARRDPAMA